MPRVPICVHALPMLAVSLIAGGCNEGDGPPAANRPPTISGAPLSAVRQGEAYEFRPGAADPDGDALTFAIRNKPDWAAFDPSSGRLHGVPGTADVGTYGDIRISVSDGRASAQLAAFAVTVHQLGLGSVTLSWTPPLTNADGSALTDLAGYRIYYGRSANALSQLVIIGTAGVTRWVIGDLTPATYFFAMTSYNVAGVESALSQVVSRTLS